MKFGLRQLAFVLVLVAIPTGASLWVFRPANNHIEQQREQIENQAKKLAELRNAAGNIHNLDSEVQKLNEAVKFFESKLPSEHEIYKVLEQVAKMADTYNLETKLFKPQKTKPCAVYSEQPIEMQVSGNFDNYYKFLLELERMPRITKILQMTLQSCNPKTPVVDATLKLSIFFADNRNAKKKIAKS